MDDSDKYYEPVPEDLEDVEDQTYQVSEEGLLKLIEWIRFEAQLWEARGGPDEDSEFSEIPFLIGFLIPEVCYYRGIPIPGIEVGGEDYAT